ncbi:hypothetical protein ABIC89_002504 [Variovorax boronicumulans]
MKTERGKATLRTLHIETCMAFYGNAVRLTGAKAD